MRKVRISKLSLLLIAALVGGALLIEHGNRIRIEAKAPAERPPGVATACPFNESVPFSPECMDFIQASRMVERRRVVAPSRDALDHSPELPARRP
jgi:hypothetical protein